MPFRETKDGVILQVKVQPKAKKDEIVGLEGQALKIKVKAPPEKGKANQACIELLASFLGIPKTRIKLLRGETSRQKVFSLLGLKAAEIKEHLGEY
ncbi:MAG: YggU family protein [Candidatus Desulfofervidaceae bacterium]|nr:YggU family protein [Candidatus Desulfofervidaceae bacterium]MDL1970788.1 DUF167 domain-containing protein [Candidatus Desulfofervidaceae bacterium]